MPPVNDSVFCSIELVALHVVMVEVSGIPEYHSCGPRTYPDDGALHPDVQFAVYQKTFLSNLQRFRKPIHM